MKKKTKLILTLAVACAGTFVLGACGGEYWDEIYEQGGTVKVIFDGSGASGLDDTSIVYYLLEEKVREGNGVELVAPDDSRIPQKQNFSLAGHFFAGWYTERTPRVENGKPVDEDGNVCVEKPVLDEDGKQKTDEDGKPLTELVSENGKSQGYIFANRWDFEKHRKLTINDVEQKGDFYELTLYAAWIPNYTYNIWDKNEAGEWEIVVTQSFNPTDASNLQTVSVPTFNEETGGMDNGRFPNVLNKTFRAAYKSKADAESQTDPLTEVVHTGHVDYEKGIAVEGTNDIYCEYDDGVWFVVTEAKQITRNMQQYACFDIKEDLDFKDVAWPSGFVTGSFAGKFIGNHHTLSNITASYTGSDAAAGGLFGNILAGAHFENVKFENVSFTIKRGSRLANSTFGLFAGNVNNAATFENVEVTGKLYVGTESTIPSEGFIETWSGEIEGKGKSQYVYTIRDLVGNRSSINGITGKIEVESVGGLVVEKNSEGSYNAYKPAKK